jgi:hypothetical protein
LVAPQHTYPPEPLTKRRYYSTICGGEEMGVRAVRGEMGRGIRSIPAGRNCPSAKKAWFEYLGKQPDGEKARAE